MSSLNSSFPLLIFFIAEVLFYFAIIAMVLRRREGQKLAAYLTAFYVLIALLVQSGQLAWQANSLPDLSPFTVEKTHWYSSLALSFLFILILFAFLEKEKFEIWIAIGVFWTIVLALLALNITQIPEILWTNGVWMIPRERLAFGVISLAWLNFTLGSLFTFRRAYKNTRQPLHRNRLSYWLPILVLLFSTDALFINFLPNWGAPLRLLGAGMLAFVVVTHHLPDLQQITRSALIYLSTTLLASLFYLLGFSLAQNLLPTAVDSNPRLAGTVIALLLATIFRPMLNFVERIVDQWMGIEKIDASKTINDYSQSISNILDMERLANVTVSLIMEAMGIKRGFLFLVDTLFLRP